MDISSYTEWVGLGFWTEGFGLERICLVVSYFLWSFALSFFPFVLSKNKPTQLVTEKKKRHMCV